MGYDLESLNVPEPSSEALNRILERAANQANDGPANQTQAMINAMEETGRFFRFNYVAWPSLIELAKRHGWTPTRDIDNEVSDADAESLADALERALAALENVEAPLPSHGRVKLPEFFRRGLASATHALSDKFKHLRVSLGHWIDSPALAAIGPRDDLSPESFWADNPDKIKRFIKFARQGRFSVR